VGGVDGRLTFQLGDDRLSTGPGDIVIAPAEARTSSPSRYPSHHPRAAL
jgi:hypothetical protein